MVLPRVSITTAEIERFAREQGLPRQGLLDYISRMDELLIANLKLMKNLEMVTNIVLPPIRRLPLTEMKRQLESGQHIPYEVKEFDMTSARTDEEIMVEGDHLTVQTDGTLTGVTIRFNMPTASAVPMAYFNPFKEQFFKLYLTHTAQTGKTLYLAIGKAASMEAIAYTTLASLNQLVPIEKAKQHGVAELANTDILAADLSPTNVPCLFRTIVMLETAGVFSAILKSGAVSKTLKFNGGAALAASGAYMFDILVHSGDTVNFQTDIAGNVTIRCQEIVGGVQ